MRRRHSTIALMDHTPPRFLIVGKRALCLGYSVVGLNLTQGSLSVVDFLLFLCPVASLMLYRGLLFLTLAPSPGKLAASLIPLILLSFCCRSRRSM